MLKSFKKHDFDLPKSMPQNLPHHLTAPNWEKLSILPFFHGNWCGGAGGEKGRGLRLESIVVEYKST